MRKYSAQAARWGLLMTTLALGATLVGTGLTSYVGARATAEAVMKTVASDTLSAVRTAVLDVGAFDQASLALIVSRMQDQGVRYVAIKAPNGPVVEAGRSLAGPASDPFRASASNGAPVVSPPLTAVAPGRERIVAPLVAPSGPSSRNDRMSGWLERPGQIGPEQTWLAVEFEPILAEQIRWRALMTFVAELAATAVLLGVAAVFWRSSLRAEAAAESAERDRQLRALGQMSAVLGHELRNPLASLKGHAQLLLEKLPAEHPGRRGAETIVNEAIRIEHLSLQILEFVRTGTVQVRREDPLAVARAAVKSGGVAGVELVASSAPATWTIDPDRMEQVLVNLLKNAREASPDGATVELVVAGEGRDLIYTVQDRGEGLPPGEEERAFEPFFTRKTKGTGLGLALARRIVEGHGGTIRAQNRPGGGTVFRIALPLSTNTRSGEAPDRIGG